MARIQSVEQDGDLRSPDLSHDQPVRPHPQRLAHQVVQGDAPGPLLVGRPRLQAHHVGVAGAQLGGVLHEHDPLVRPDQAEQRGQQRALARPRASRHQE
jgi:hypothetical protein